MNDFLEKNLKTQKELEAIYKEQKNDLYQIENSKTDYPTFKIENIYQHSKYDPVKESEKIVELLTKDQDEIDVLVIYGCGLGYIARMLFEKIIKNNNAVSLPYIIYIEKDIKVFLTSLKYFDWSELFSSANFKFFLDTDKETIGSFIQTIPTKRIRYYHHRPSLTFNEKYYHEVQVYIEYVLDRKDMNMATFAKFQKLWTKNFIYNLAYYPETKALTALSNTGKGTTAVIVAGGPSLDDHLDYLKKVSESSVIIAVDTVYKLLKKHSIKVDILVTVDPQFWNYKYVENEKIDSSIIIAESSTYPKIFELAPVENFFVGSSIFPLVDYFDPQNKLRGTLAAGGSVATSAFDAARIIGSDNIICIGLDLSFPGRMTHFKGSYFEKNFLNISDYFSTSEYLSYSYLAHAQMRSIESTDNKSVFTDQKMFLFKKWFDREIPLTNAKVFQPNSGGVKLEGANITSKNDLPLGDKDLKNNYIENINKILSNKKLKDKRFFDDKIKKIIDHSKVIKRTSDDILKLIPEELIVNEKNHNLINNLEKELFIDLERSSITRIISSSAQDILLRIIENVQYNKDEKKSAWKKTKLLYDSISKLSTFYVDCLHKLFIRNT